MDMTTNIVIAGLGGQGVLTASDILAQAAFHAGLDVKKSEVHGMSQRGGSVASDVRFGSQVWSPMVPQGEADFLLVLQEDQLEPNRHYLKKDGVVIDFSLIQETELPNRKSANVALLGVLSRYLPWNDQCWHEAIRENLPEKLWEINLRSFSLGRGQDISIRSAIADSV